MRATEILTGTWLFFFTRSFSFGHHLSLAFAFASADLSRVAHVQTSNLRRVCKMVVMKRFKYEYCWNLQDSAAAVNCRPDYVYGIIIRLWDF